MDSRESVHFLLRARRRFVNTTSVIVRALWHIFLLYLILVYRNQIFFGYPLIAEGVIQAVCSEVNRRKMLARRSAAAQMTCEDKMEIGSAVRAECIATVVGYREDATIFRQCLDSYDANFDNRHKAVCIGIDGNDQEDLEMTEVAEQVFGDRLLKIELPESFGQIARNRMMSDFNYEKQHFREKGDDSDGWMVASLMTKAADILRSHGVLYCSADDPQPICIVQPHHSKKEIMFTTFIFALALARANDVEFIWSSDSDSWVFKDTIATAIDCIQPDEKLAGSCTSLTIHNGKASVVASMVAATYETDLALTSGLLSSCDSTDCQSGPCAIFRCEALKSIILPWYNQMVLGQRPIVNEDRHLTTRILLTGDKVTYNPLIEVATDTPTTITKWCAQQVRWSRATAIETFCYPRMFMMRHPVLFIYSFRRLLVPVVNFAIVTRYLVTGVGSQFSSMEDIGVRVLLCALYATLHRNNGIKGFFIHAFSQVFLQVPQAAFLFYASITMFDSSWGGGLRSGSAKSGLLQRQFGGKHVGAMLVTILWVATVAAAFTRYLTTSFDLLSPLYATVGGFCGGAGLLLWGIAIGM
ncbi:Hypothetical protein D9617_35g090170 [Elsinoe fawcettii]|nr:Hypothetical protein D9617_35g090170 [Elsinoe fawcettii]